MKFNKKKVIAILLAITIIGFSLGTIIVIFNPGSVVFGQRGIPFSNLGNSDTKTATLEIDQQSQITIVNSVGDLVVETYDGDKIEVVYEAYEKSVLYVNKTNNQIKIEGKITPRGSVNNINTSNTPVLLKVLLPSEFNQNLSVKNGVGKSTLNVGEYTNFDAKIGVGDMRLTPRSITGGSFLADVGVGSITINLPENLDVRLTASAGLGSVSNRFKFDSQESSDKFISQSFRGTTGQGSATVTLKVGTGEISIR